MTQPLSYEDTRVAWVDDDHGGDLIVVMYRTDGTDRPVLEMSPLDALALAGQIIGLARDALQAQSGEPSAVIARIHKPGDLGPVLRQARQEARLSCVALGERVGAAGPTITSAELGTRHPRLPLMIDVLEALGCHLAVIRRA